MYYRYDNYDLEPLLNKCSEELPILCWDDDDDASGRSQPIHHSICVVCVCVLQQSHFVNEPTYTLHAFWQSNQNAEEQ